MRKSTRSAFTLVELIVVITILAILGTIGFMSIKGYTAEAQNAKVTSDLTTIQRGLETKVAEGGSLMAFVKGTDTNDINDISLAGITTDSGSTTVAGTKYEYQVGTPNYTALGIKKEEFVDPNGNEYRIGATTFDGGKIELTGVITSEGTKESTLKGSYAPRDTSTGAIASISGKVIVLDGALTNFFNKGDTVIIGKDGTADGTDYVVKTVKRDGITLILDQDVSTNDQNEINLKAQETAGLIADRDGDDATNNVITEDNNRLPY